MSSIINHNGLHFGRGSNAGFVFGKSKDNHTIISPKSEGGKKIAFWGEDNQYPKHFLKALRKNGVAGSGLRVLKSTHYGQGFSLYTEEIKEGVYSKKLVDIKEHSEIAEFFRKNKMHRLWVDKIQNLETFNLGMPEFILSNDYSKIVSVKILPTPKTRYSTINESNGLIEYVYFCHNWTSSTDLDSEYVHKIPVIDSYWDAEQIKEYCKKKKIHKFVMPCFYPMMDEVYYPEVDWHSVYHNGWMDVANSIPEYKKHLFENQLNIKFMVYISEEYFIRYYRGEWSDYTVEKKNEIRKQLTNAIDEHLSGNKSAGKSIQSTVFKGSDGEWIKGIEVVPINDVLKDGSFLPEATAANSEISFAQGIDPTIMGAGIPGGKQTSGGGSDKREAFTILTALFKTKREITLDTWRLLRDYNGWSPELEGGFTNIILTTLADNSSGAEITV